jgi:hypothetical protein
MVRVGGDTLIRAREGLEKAEEGFEDGLDGGLAELDEGGSGDVEDVVVGESLDMGASAMWQLR